MFLKANVTYRQIIKSIYLESKEILVAVIYKEKGHFFCSFVPFEINGQ